MSLIHFLTFVVVILIVALLVVAIHKRTGDKSRGLAKLAAKLGLPVMNGERGFFGEHLQMAFILDVWRGREVNIHHIVRTSTKSRTQTYSAAIEMPVKVPADLRMTFTSKNILTQAVLQPGLEQVATGDADFDNFFYVKSTDANVAKSLMNPALSSSFVKTWAENGVCETLSVREGRIHYEEPGRINSSDMRNRFAAMVDLCRDLAEALEKTAQPAPEVK